MSNRDALNLHHALSQPPVAITLITHAILLNFMTWGTIAALYYQPRFYTSTRPQTADSERIETLCAHPDTKSRAWHYIIIHHSATTGGSAAAFERFHIHVEHWDSLGYHFVIGNGTQTGNGEVEVGPRWEKQKQGSHAPGYNDDGIGICLVGNFDSQQPTAAQLTSLRQLVLYLVQKYDIPISHVVGHNECDDARTACPGKAMEMTELRDWLEDKLHSQNQE